MTVLAAAKPRVKVQTVRPEPVEGLPPGWARVSITEISHSLGGGTPSKSDPSYWTDGTVPWVSPKDMKSFHIISSEDAVTESALKRLSLIPTNSVLLVVRSGILSHTLPVGLNALPVTINQDMRAFVTAPEVSARYLAWQLVSRGREILSACSKDGTTVASIEALALARFPLTLAPTAEQTRIVEKLEELLSDLDAGVAELKAAQKKLTQYRQSLLKAAVEGALTAQWRVQRLAATPSPRGGGMGRGSVLPAPSLLSHHPLPNPPPQGEGTCESGAQLLERILKERRARWQAKQLAKFKEQGKAPPKDWQDKYPEPVKPDTTDLPPLPEGWVWSSIGQCFYVGVGATPSRKEPAYWNGDVPWVSSGEVRFDRIVDTKEKISNDGLDNSSTQINPVGSVMLGMIGEGKTRGQVAILDIEAANNQNCAAIWVTETGIPSEYVYYWLWSRYDETRRGSSGNNQPALNKSIVESIPFPLPPLDEAEVIVASMVAAFEQASVQDGAIQYALKQSTAQRKNILKAAFSGQLVPQDPNDEPASVLLARIRAERAGLALVKTVKKRVPAPVVDNFGLSHLNPERAWNPI